ncbi:hypothetical protein SAMN04487981_14016 [Streptomyces sp. cf386]|nr:hypothetical protein SAMN04487981_14016 [Streptomyces sp. cf386]
MPKRVAQDWKTMEGLVQRDVDARMGVSIGSRGRLRALHVILHCSGVKPQVSGVRRYGGQPRHGLNQRLCPPRAQSSSARCGEKCRKTSDKTQSPGR